MQARFLLFEVDNEELPWSKEDANESPLDPPYKWFIPISYTSAGGDFEETTKNQFWMKPTDPEQVRLITSKATTVLS